MRSLLILVSVLVAMSVFAWRENVSDCPQIVVGKDSVGNKVYARYLNFLGEADKPGEPDEEFHFNVVKDQPLLTIGYRREFVIYDYVTGKLKTKIKWPRNARFEDATADGFLISSYNPWGFSPSYTFHFYDFEGKKLWETKKNPEFFKICKDVVVSASQTGIFAFSPCKLTGLDIKTGNKLWEKAIHAHKHFQSCCYHISKRDSTKIYIIADSLVCIDIITGASTSHSFSAGENANIFHEYTIGPADTVYDPNLSTDNLYSIFIPNAFTGFHSNWIEKGDTLFIADAKNIYAFDSNLKPYWITSLPEMRGAKSSIRLVGDRLVFFNYGVGFNRSNVKTAGLPFAAAVSIIDGKPVSTTYPGDNDHMIGGYYTDSGRIYWLTRRKLFYCDEGEEELHEIDWKSRARYYSADQRMPYSIQDTVWVEKDNKVVAMATDRDKVIVSDWGKQVHVIQLDGSEEILSSDNVFFKDPVNNSLNGNQSFIGESIDYELGRYSKIAKEVPRRGEYLIFDSLSNRISHIIYTPELYGHNKEHLLIDLVGGVGFVDLNNPGEDQ